MAVREAASDLPIAASPELPLRFGVASADAAAAEWLPPERAAGWIRFRLRSRDEAPEFGRTLSPVPRRGASAALAVADAADPGSPADPPAQPVAADDSAAAGAAGAAHAADATDAGTAANESYLTPSVRPAPKRRPPRRPA